MTPFNESEAFEEKFATEGLCAPFRVLDPDAVSALRALSQEFSDEDLAPIDGTVHIKAHLLSTQLDAVVRHPRLVIALEALLGEHVVLRESELHIEAPAAGVGRVINLRHSALPLSTRARRGLQFRQDLPFRNLSGSNLVTVVLALTDLNHLSGAPRFIPGSHHAVYDGSPPSDLRCIELAPGECVMHHGNLACANGTNVTREQTMTLVLRYMSSDMYCHTGVDSVTWIQGDMLHNEFVFEPRADVNFDEGARNAHERALAYPSGLGRGDVTH